MYVFEFEGESWTTDDYTLNEMAELEDLLDVRWGDIEPRARAKHLLALLTVWLCRTRTEDDTAKAIKGLKLGDLDGLVTYDVGDDLPNASRDGVPLADAQGTSGSSSAPTDSDGSPATPEPSPSAT